MTPEVPRLSFCGCKVVKQRGKRACGIECIRSRCLDHFRCAGRPGDSRRVIRCGEWRRRRTVGRTGVALSVRVGETQTLVVSDVVGTDVSVANKVLARKAVATSVGVLVAAGVAVRVAVGVTVGVWVEKL